MSLIDFEDIKSPAIRSRVLDILVLAVGYPTPEKLSRIQDTYLSPTHRLFVLIENDRVAGIIGIRLPGPQMRILHIAVAPHMRRQGVGRRLLTEVMGMYRATEVFAETDKNSVGFYRACGFSVSSLGEKYPGVERFECVSQRRTSILDEGEKN